jgi:hypothetical protein
MKLNTKALLLAGLAATGAAWLASGSSTPSYEDQLLGVAVRQSFGDAASQVTAQPLEVQALLLDYADNEPLLLKARLALLRYPDLTRRILPIYGTEREFQEVLLNYGEAALPPVGYFMDHDLTSLEMRRALGYRVEEIKLLYGRLKGAPEDAAPSTTAPSPKLSAEERGWYAVQFLLEDGYDFLGQFAVARDGKAVWVQTERVTEGLSDLFLGGVRGLETKWREGTKVEGADLGWAALDVAVIATSVKLVKAVWAGRAAATGADAGVTAARAGGFAGPVARFGSRVLARGGRLAIAVAGYGAIPAAVYLMFRYPSMINASLVELGSWLGISPWLMQFVFWFVALLITLRLTLLLLAPLSWALRSLGVLTGTLAVLFRPVHAHRRLDPHIV